MITTTRIYAFGALALAAMIGVGLYRQSHTAPTAQAQPISATQPATASASAPASQAATQMSVTEEIAAKRRELSNDSENLALQARLAFLLISQPVPSQADITEATQLIENACRKSQFKERSYIETLGKVYAVAGKYESAIKVGEIVRMLAENAQDREAVLAADVRLEIYRHMQLQKQIDDDIKRLATQPATQPR